MIIGLSGQARSGKDTLCEIMKERHAGQVVRKAFADKLKLSAYRLFKPDCTLEEAVEWANVMKEQGYVDMAYDSGKGAHLSGRQLLQRYGTEAHRDLFGKDFWVDATLPHWDGMGHTEESIFGTSSFEDYVVFTDVRFPNEAERIREWGGEIWEIRREETDTVDGHVSEQRLPAELVDCIFYNNRSLDEFGELIQTSLDIRAGLVGE